MPYPAAFHRLVLMGTLYDDTFNTTLSIIPLAGSGTIGLPPAADCIGPIEATLENFWSRLVGAGGAGIHANAILTSLKLNSIGTDGKYTESETHELAADPVLPGGGTGNFPAQVATVATIRTSVERGLASKGRMFLPVCTGFGSVGTDGRATEASAQRVADATADWFEAVNAVYVAQQSGDESLGRVGVASNRGAGMFRGATRVTVGRVPDTIRSRRNKLIEAPMEATITL